MIQKRFAGLDRSLDALRQVRGDGLWCIRGLRAAGGVGGAGIGGAEGSQPGLGLGQFGDLAAELFDLLLERFCSLILFLSLTVLSVNLLGDGMRDALDPRLARRL